MNCWSGPEAPTLTVTVFVVTEVISRLLEYASWPGPGSACSVLLPSMAQVNTNDSLSNPIALDVVNPWALPKVITKSPVAGS